MSSKSKPGKADKKPEGFRDGVKKVGADKFLLRCLWYDKEGKRHDTERVFYCPSRVRAIQERERIEKELQGQAVGWTVAQACASLDAQLHLTSGHSLRSHMRKVCSVFGERKLSSIQPDEIQRFLRDLKVKDTSATNIRAAFSRVYKHAKAQGEFSGQNPVLLTEPRRTVLSPEERMQLLEAEPPRKAMLGEEIPRFIATLSRLEPEIYPLILTQLNLGCRFAEASTLQWRDINLETGAVVIRRAQYRLHLGPPKSGRSRLYALGPLGLAVLRTHKERIDALGWPGADLWCFPCPPTIAESTGRPRRATAIKEIWAYQNVLRRLRDVFTASGVTLDAVTHAMRHTHVTAARGANNDELLRLAVGHASPKMTTLYTAQQAGPVVQLATTVENLLGMPALWESVAKQWVPDGEPPESKEK